MKDIYKESIDIAVKEVIGMMAGLNLIQEEPYFLKEPASLGQVSAAIGFYGPGLEGAVIAHFNKRLALVLLDCIFGIKADDITPDVFDAVGEVTNMICGRMKTELTARLGREFSMTVPTVIYGEKYITLVRIKEPAFVMPYQETEGTEKLSVELFLREF